MLVVTAMAKLIAAMLVGYVCVKKGILSSEATAKLSSFIIFISSPFYTLYSVSMISGDAGSSVAIILISSVIFFTGELIFSRLLFRFWKVPGKKGNAMQMMLIFGNCGFMAIPVCQSLYGDGVVLLISMFVIPYGVYFYTYGIRMIGGEGKSLKETIKKIINPGLIASLLTLVLFFGKIKLPSFINEPLGFIGNVTMPLSMVCIGASVAKSPLKKVFSDPQLYVISFLRLFVIPVITYVLLRLFIEDRFLVNLITLIAAMPVGSMTAMGAIEYHGDEETASNGVTLSTLLSMITIPILVLIISNIP